jgi:hypothetical protein
VLERHDFGGWLRDLLAAAHGLVRLSHEANDLHEILALAESAQCRNRKIWRPEVNDSQHGFEG